jgi:hypothetical protein
MFNYKNIIYYLLTFACFFVYADPGLFGKEASNEASALFGGAERIERDYDRSDLDDYVAYRLYALDPAADYYNRAFYHIYTVSFLSKDVAEESIVQQIDQLEASIEESYATLAIDEQLRQQIVGLTESVKTLELISSAAPQTALYRQALEAIGQGLSRYREIQTLFHRYALQQKKLVTGKTARSEDRLLAEIIACASTPGRISDYAWRFEERFDTEAWTKVKEACGATANALSYFFLEKGLVDFQKESREGIDTLISRIENNRDSQKGVLYLVDAAKLDHVFTIQQTSDGRYRILQSFINRYSLLADLYQQPNSLSYEEVQLFCRQLKVLLASEEWNGETEGLYKLLFLTAPAAHVAQGYRQAAKFSFFELSYSLSTN